MHGIDMRWAGLGTAGVGRAARARGLREHQAGDRADPATQRRGGRPYRPVPGGHGRDRRRRNRGHGRRRRTRALAERALPRQWRHANRLDVTGENTSGANSTLTVNVICATT
jgi:hypothetical protein